MRALIFDTETTSTKDPHLVEASWLSFSRWGDPCADESFSRRYNPGVPITFGAMATHHITDEDVAACPPASEFRLPEDTAYLIGHKIDFDWEVAQSCGPQPEPKRICTLALSRSLWPDCDSHTLMALLYLHMLDRHYARRIARAGHGSATDVAAAQILLDYILQALPAVDSWEALWEASEVARVPTVMYFGKFEGLPIRDVPSDYKAWLLRQPNVDPYLMKALRGR